MYINFKMYNKKVIIATFLIYEIWSLIEYDLVHFKK